MPELSKEKAGSPPKGTNAPDNYLFHAHATSECVSRLESDAIQGLSSATALSRLHQYGPNELVQQKRSSLLSLFCEQFDDFLVKILIVSALISFLLALVEDNGQEGASAFIEPLVIVAILILNAGMGVYQEQNAQSAVDRLKQMQSDTSRVVRDGVVHPSVASSELVPGDIVELSAGDRVPADCRLLKLKSTTLRTNESCLTGESNEVDKYVSCCLNADCDLSERWCELFCGTTVSIGSCRSLVVHTGMHTEMGGIQSGLLRSAEEDKKTPLSEKLDEFGEVLAKIIGVICILVWLVNIRNFSDPIHGGTVRGAIYYLKIAVSLGVAAIPEGLPAVITLCLSLGSSRMARKNCIVRKLPSVETLGCTTVICSDKTGTLTTNRMVVQRLLHFGLNDGVLEEHRVSGTDYDPRGSVESVSSLSSNVLNRISQIGSLSTSDTSVQWDSAQRSFVCSGSPTEAALRVLSEKLGSSSVRPLVSSSGSKTIASDTSSPLSACDLVSQSWESQYDRVLTLEFTSDRKRMSVLCRGHNSSDPYMLLGKGAPELILEECDRVMLGDGRVVPMSASCRQQVQKAITRLASESLRTLALFEKRETSDLQRFVPRENSLALHLPPAVPLYPEQFPSFERQLTFCGLVGIRDPPRPEVFESIRRCHEAGIRVMMITGDNEVTACAIAREIGIFGSSESEAEISAKSFHGKTFMSYPLNRQLDLLRGGGGRVFSRTEPSHKQHLVSLLRDLHEVVAMTGDGVNDAPALSNADIGIAMGVTGTEVAKDAAAMVLADDNFATIVSAVEEGRAIYQNTKAFIRYLISSNIGEVVSVFLTAVSGLPEALIPVQLLWVNLVTDGPPATALGFNPVDPMAMSEAPRGRDEPLITPWILFRYIVIGFYVGLATVGIFVYWYVFDVSGSAVDGHTLISMRQLLNWSECPNWSSFHVADFKGVNLSHNGCDYFGPGKETASTLSLTVLVTIEMLNALNAISENNSLLSIPIWSNRNLLIAVVSSFALHFCILYIPLLNVLFQVDPLTVREWWLVILFSLPVIVIEEVLKFISRRYHLH